MTRAFVRAALPAALFASLLPACNDRRGAVLSSPPPARPEVQTAGPAAGPAPEAEPDPSGGPGRASVRCKLDESCPGLWKVPEASAAAEVMLVPGKREIIVLSDSGNNGDALLWAIPSGPFRPLKLELDGAASDDIEGGAWTGGHLYTLTSSGAVRRFSPDGKGGLRLDGAAYAIGPPPYSCPKLTGANCGPNYEGLCLRPSAGSARCAGYAASKANGTLACVVFDGDRLRVDPIKPALALDVPRHALSDCAFAAEGSPAKDRLLVTTNIYGGSTVYEVDETRGALRTVDVPGLPNNEAIAIDRDGTLYEWMDSDGDTSLAYRLTCEGW